MVLDFYQTNHSQDNNKMTTDDLEVSDGHIYEIFSSERKFYVMFQDWQKKKWTIEFVNVIGYEAYSAEGEELDSIEIESNNSFIDKSIEITEEEGPFWKCYSFISAWTEKTILRIVAKNCYVNQFMAS